jgi:hypothetical protein
MRLMRLGRSARISLFRSLSALVPREFSPAITWTRADELRLEGFRELRPLRGEKDRVLGELHAIGDHRWLG